MKRYHFGLLGHNIAYSLTPRIFNLIFEFRKIQCDFSIFDIPPADLPNQVDNLLKLDGFSVTIPFKEIFSEYLSARSDEVKEIGAVNSVEIKDGGFGGHNTDWLGFVASLSEIEIALRRVLILGYGGAAKAVIYGLNRLSSELELSVSGRDKDKLYRFCSQMRHLLKGKNKIESVLPDQLITTGKFDLIVNCTPLGDRNHIDQSPLPENFDLADCQMYYDLVYDPLESLFLNRAGKQGAKTVNGIRMLVEQAIKSYIIWSKDMVDLKLLRAHVYSSLETLRE